MKYILSPYDIENLLDYYTQIYNKYNAIEHENWILHRSNSQTYEDACARERIALLTISAIKELKEYRNES